VLHFLPINQRADSKQIPTSGNPAKPQLLSLPFPTHATMTEEKQTKRFEPKVPVQLDPPKDDPISQEELAKCDGMALSLTETLPRQSEQL
jgi:hypothetical protein